MASSRKAEGEIKKCDNLLKILDSSTGRVIIVTYVEQSTLTVCATDGLNVWKSVVSETDTDKDGYLTKLSSSLPSCSLTVTSTACRLHSSDAQSLDMHLDPVTPEDEKRSELQRIMFRVADRSLSVEAKLKTTQEKLESLQRKPAAQNVFDMGLESKKKKTQPKAQPKQAGMSVINPGSKKRAAPKGVEFD